jgi:hypothetical protein
LSRSRKNRVSLVFYLCKRGSGWGRNRTADTRIFSPLLCQLSYPAVASSLRQEVHYASFPKSGKRLLFCCGVAENGSTLEVLIVAVVLLAGLRRYWIVLQS